MTDILKNCIFKFSCWICIYWWLRFSMPRDIIISHNSENNCEMNKNAFTKSAHMFMKLHPWTQNIKSYLVQMKERFLLSSTLVKWDRWSHFLVTCLTISVPFTAWTGVRRTLVVELFIHNNDSVVTTRELSNPLLDRSKCCCSRPKTLLRWAAHF